MGCASGLPDDTSAACQACPSGLPSPPRGMCVCVYYACVRACYFCVLFLQSLAVRTKARRTARRNARRKARRACVHANIYCGDIITKPAYNIIVTALEKYHQMRCLLYDQYQRHDNHKHGIVHVRPGARPTAGARVDNCVHQ